MRSINKTKDQGVNVTVPPSAFVLSVTRSISMKPVQHLCVVPGGRSDERACPFAQISSHSAS